MQTHRSRQIIVIPKPDFCSGIFGWIRLPNVKLHFGGIPNRWELVGMKFAQIDAQNDVVFERRYLFQDPSFWLVALCSFLPGCKIWAAI